MSQVTNHRVVEEPVGRGGSAPAVVSRDDGRIVKVLRNLHDDKNLIYLAARLQNYSETTDARLAGLKRAVDEDDSTAVVDIAHALTDATAKLGAIRMMKLCIAMQMVGRRGLIFQARTLLLELEAEYNRFKETLIYSVG